MRPVTVFTVVRDRHDSERTFSRLFQDGRPVLCEGQPVLILEDEPRNIKIYGETRIPAGTYPIRISYSPLFKTNLVEIQNVPGFTGIRMHPGNTDDDTDGCLLPGNATGMVKGEPGVINSRVSYQVIHDRVEAAIMDGMDLFISILDAD